MNTSEIRITALSAAAMVGRSLEPDVLEHIMQKAVVAENPVSYAWIAGRNRALDVKKHEAAEARRQLEKARKEAIKNSMTQKLWVARIEFGILFAVHGGNMNLEAIKLRLDGLSAEERQKRLGISRDAEYQRAKRGRDVIKKLGGSPVLLEVLQWSPVKLREFAAE